MGNVRGQIKSTLKRTVLYDALTSFRAWRDARTRPERDRVEIEVWERSGNPVPPPYAFKQQTVRSYGERFGIRSFVETGTCLGDMVDAVKTRFTRIYSIELDNALFERAKLRFSPYGHITILQGDSGRLLPDILRELREPCLFWLDAHYSGGFTARGELDTPILVELESILRHEVRGHVILIDDARDFTGERDYPTIDEVRRFVLARWPQAAFSVEHDMMRIVCAE